jgi:hypothetical protein
MDLPGKSADGYRHINLLDVETLVNVYLSRRCQDPEQGYLRIHPHISESDTIEFACGLESLAATWIILTLTG